MSNACTDRIPVGPYTGWVAAEYRAPDALASLARLPDLLQGAGVRALPSGRHRNLAVCLRRNGEAREVVVKAFGRQGWIKDAIDHARGSKAARSCSAARTLLAAGAGTPPPVAFLDRWSGLRLVESYYVSEYQAEISSFRQELSRLFRDEPECAKFMALLETVAVAVRKMHAAGFLHRDLGNQNILLRRASPSTWADVQFIDLNRGRVGKPLTLRERARDLSRIYLPSDLLRVFLEMYFAPAPPPREFRAWERHYRGRYAWHTRSRACRHPWRHLQRPGLHEPEPYPAEKDMWVWDERSAQAISVLRTRERHALYSVRRQVRIAALTLAAAPGVWREYRRILPTAFSRPLNLRSRIGLAVEPAPATFDRQLALLAGLGRIPVLVRFYHHEERDALLFRAAAARQLRDAGHPVSIALVQDRRAVLDPERWEVFCESVLSQTRGIVEWAEVGHAINRVKWGIWDCDEYRRLVAPLPELAERFPGTRFVGPAAIDFEYPFVISALRAMPAGARWHALSHHLYVDRRGTPENRQAGFALLEKCALGLAIARRSGASEDRFIVSEVNWPLAGTGVWSPVGSPYESPGPRFGDPSVSEPDYAAYLVRYYLIALCSGFVDQVFWWRLAARGFGLVDDTDPAAWRERPAYRAMAQLVAAVGECLFESRAADPLAGTAQYFFRRADGERVCVAYSAAGATPWKPPFRWRAVQNAFGEPAAAPAALEGLPVYFRGVED